MLGRFVGVSQYTEKGPDNKKRKFAIFKQGTRSLNRGYQYRDNRVDILENAYTVIQNFAVRETDAYLEVIYE